MTANSSSNPTLDDSFYASDPMEGDLLYQGEIIVDTPILQMPKPTRWLVLRTNSGKRVDEALNYGKVAAENRVRVLDSNQFPLQWTEAGLGDFVAAVLDKAPALVLSQNCDIATKEFIQVAPIVPVYPEDEARIGRLKEHAILDSFYLQPHSPQWENVAYADFGLIQSIHKTYVKTIPPENHFRLSTPNVLQLQKNLTRFFGRPNAYDANADSAPRNGTYMCVKCFYYCGVITGVALAQNSPFPICEKCGGVGWVPRLNSVPGA